MDVYKDILNIDESVIERLSSIGLLRSNAKRDLDIYAYYLKEVIEGKGKTQAHVNAADYFLISDESVKKIVNKIKNNV